MADPTNNPLAPVDAPKPPIPRQREVLSATKIVFNKFGIDLTRPLNDFENTYADAYEAESLDTNLSDSVAIVIKGRYPAQQESITNLLADEHETMLSIRDTGVVDWPDGTHRFVIIYRRPVGAPAIPRHTPKREPFSEDMIRNSVIRPISDALYQLANHGIFHGNIRTDNIYLSVHENAEAVLGECASSLPGINQPATYETIERCMADPHGKGPGKPMDDIYSFGVTVAILLRGQNPLEGKTTREIIEEKIARGSYAVFTDGLRLSPGLSEFLRATLNDDPRQRWGIDQLMSWTSGNRTTPKQVSGAQKAQRAIDFNGKKYTRTRLLAMDLHDNVSEAVALIESGHIVKWVERAIGDLETANLITEAIGRANVGGKNAGYEERLLCLVCMALDPRAPIRFKDIKVFPTGIGYAMAYLQLNDEKIQNYGELIRDRYAWVWLNYKENTPADVSIMHLFDQASKTISRRGIDFGLERCFYEFCKSSPCLSPYFANHYVINCSYLLKAIEDVSDQYKHERPMDRHIACFLSVHDTRDNAGLLLLLEGTNVMKKSLAMITLYQSLQKRYDNPKLPGLSEWLMRDAEVVAQRFHNLMLKQDIIKEIPKAVKSGSLMRLMALVDNPAEVKKDEHDFVAAGHYYHAIENEKEIIRRNLSSNHAFGRKEGQQIALSLSVILAGVMIALSFLFAFLDKGN
jgi:hypothetical protein